jgi:hypothetical protein
MLKNCIENILPMGKDQVKITLIPDWLGIGSMTIRQYRN